MLLEPSNYEETNIGDTQNEVQIDEVKLSKKKTGVILIVFIVFLILIIVVGREVISARSRSKNNSAVSATTVESEKNGIVVQTEKNASESFVKDTSNDGEEPTKSTKKVVVSEESDSSQSNETKDGESVGSENQVSIVEVEGVEFVSEGVTNALVSSRGIYLVDGDTYSYSINLLIPTDSKYLTVRYFSSEKIYNAVETGDSLEVSYKLDENGNISISSLSK